MSASTVQNNLQAMATPDVDLTRMTQAEQMTFFMEQMR
jgi:uncharacterized membrane protein YwaF